MVRVAIVDDHGIVRAGFREMLANETGISIAFEAASGEEALARLQGAEKSAEKDTEADTEAGAKTGADTNACDVLLLDLAMPGQSGVDVLRTLRQRHSGLHVLVLTGYPEERYALAMIRHGADGYLCKECGRDELLHAVRTVAQGRRYVSPHMAQLLAAELVGDAPAAAHQQLSERELQVFLRLARGQSVSEIGDMLNISVKTVSTYRTRLLEKLGVASNAQLAAYALRNGLIGE